MPVVSLLVYGLAAPRWPTQAGVRPHAWPWDPPNGIGVRGVKRGAPAEPDDEASGGRGATDGAVTGGAGRREAANTTIRTNTSKPPTARDHSDFGWRMISNQPGGGGS
jgi:hypothetical protein